MKVQDVMTRSVVTCGAEDSLHDAARTLWERDLGCLVVVGNDGRPMAMLTDRDICMAAFTTGKPLHELRVAGAMSKQVTTCRASEDTAAVATRMGKHGVRRLPVLDASGNLVGIVGLGDLAAAASREPAAKVTGAAGEALRTLATITAPRQAPASGTAVGTRAAAAQPEALVVHASPAKGAGPANPG